MSIDGFLHVSNRGCWFAPWPQYTATLDFDVGSNADADAMTVAATMAERAKEGIVEGGRGFIL